MSILLWLFLMHILAICHGYKILVFSPTYTKSHMIMNGRIADELALAGHDLTLLDVELIIKTSEFKSAKHVKIRSIGPFPNEEYIKSSSMFSDAFAAPPSRLQHFKNYLAYHKAFNGMCEVLLRDFRHILDELKEEKFDIIFAEQVNLCGLALKEALNIKTHFWVCAMPIMDHVGWILGAPTPLSYVPSVGELDISDRMSYLERIRNIIEYIGDTYVYLEGIRETTKIFRKYYGTDFPDVEQIARDSAITFVLADEFLDFPRPVLHNVVYIGGFGISSNVTDLKEPFKSELQKGKNGIVYFSLGSSAKTNSIPVEFKKNLLESFKSLPDYHFLVKINEGDQIFEDLASHIPNVFTFRWAPQPEILAHPRLKAFITHGGYNSLIETARAGVPIVTLPFFIDQWRNGRVAERNGWGVTFDKKKLLLGHTEFLEELKKILHDPSYKQKALRTMKLLLTKPFSSSEKLIKYVEFVASNEGVLPELQNEGRNLSFFVYYNLDIFVPFIGLVLILVYVVLRLIFVIIKRVFLSRNVQKKVKKQ